MTAIHIWLIGLSAYYIISRIFTIFSIGFRGGTSMVKESLSDGTILFLMVPVFGDFFVLDETYQLIFINVVLMIGGLENYTAIMIEDSKKKKQELKRQRVNYLNSLSKYGLKESDIPAFVKDPASLKEYLDVWKNHS